MIPMTIQQAAENCNAHLNSGFTDTDSLIKTVSTDSRLAMSDGLFIALKGEHFDGHHYIDAAAEKGAIACLIEDEIDIDIESGLGQLKITQLKVNDTTQAMGELASSVREQLSIPCVGITGSTGKTTVKEMVAAILNEKGTVLATEGNFNNAIGVPLTLFRLTEDDQYAVIEMGASKVGDIDEIAQWVKPNVAVITNVSEAHLQGLGDLKGVAKVKGELLNHLDEKGVAVLNYDCDFLTQWSSKLSEYQSYVTVSQATKIADKNPQSDYSSSHLNFSEKGGTTFIAHTPQGDVNIRCPLTGMHNVTNALTAMAASIAMGASLDNCLKGLSKVKAVNGRTELLSGIFGSRIINDSYNANPASLNAAIESLLSFDGHHLLILGDMAELGEQAELAHRRAGEKAKQLGIECLFAIGTLSLNTVEGFGVGAEYFKTRQELIQAIEEKLKKSEEGIWNLLIKGSRSAAMEELLEPLVVTKVVTNKKMDNN